MDQAHVVSHAFDENRACDQYFLIVYVGLNVCDKIRNEKKCVFSLAIWKFV